MPKYRAKVRTAVKRYVSGTLKSLVTSLSEGSVVDVAVHGNIGELIGFTWKDEKPPFGVLMEDMELITDTDPDPPQPPTEVPPGPYVAEYDENHNLVRYWALWTPQG